MSALITSGPYEVYDLILTPEKLKGMWEKMLQHPALNLFGRPEAFVDAFLDPKSIHFEVYEEGEPVGLVFVTDVGDAYRQDVHAVFYDSKLVKRVPVCQELARYIFDAYGLTRLTASPPETYGATIRFLQRVGFRKEGRLKKAITLKGRTQDVLLFGLIPEYLRRS